MGNSSSKKERERSKSFTNLDLITMQLDQCQQPIACQYQFERKYTCYAKLNKSKRHQRISRS